MGLRTDNTFKSGFVMVFALLIGLAAAFVIATKGFVFGGLIMVALAGLVIIYFTAFDVKFGMIATLVISFFISFSTRELKLGRYPVGMVIDFLLILMVIGFLLGLKKKGAYKFEGNAMNIGLLVWLILNMLEFFNPYAPSKMGWIYAVRNNLNIIMMYFLFYYALDSMKYLNRVITIWCTIMFLACLYALKQKFFGLSNAEYHLVYDDPLRRNLYITWGKLRLFSFLNDPMSFGIIVVYSIILNIGLLFAKLKTKVKVMLGVLLGLLLYVLLMTSTRTAYFLLPLGMIVFALVSMNKKVLALMGFAMVIGIGVVLMPGGGGSMHIFKSAFQGNDDPSMNVRSENQKFIRPYILDKPLGWGLASTGGWGRKFNRGTVLGHFPPDSEYVRIAIETGWVGLLLWFIILILMFRQGLINYFKVKDENRKIYYATFIAIFYLIIVAQYPQEALRVPPTGIFSAFVMAVLAKLKDIEC